MLLLVVGKGKRRGRTAGGVAKMRISVVKSSGSEEEERLQLQDGVEEEEEQQGRSKTKADDCGKWLV